MAKNFYITAAEMDDYQRRIVNRKSESSLVVKGCAGSGKSVIAFWRLHDIVSNNKGSVQIVVFTKSLKDYFMEGCRSEGIAPELVDYWYNWSRHPKTTDYLLVDEAQDFTQDEILRFQQHAGKALLLYGDTSQQIYQSEPPKVTMEEAAVITNSPSAELVFNYRLPERVAAIAEYLNVERDDLVGRCKVEGHEPPYILRYNSFDEQICAIADLIDSRGLSNVGILLQNNNLVKLTTEGLRRRGFNVECKYSIDRGDYENNLNFATENAKVMTYHSAKGLQFETVFLPCCEESGMRGFLGPLYVAMTRTYGSLFIMYTEELPKVLQQVPANLYETDARPKETELL